MPGKSHKKRAGKLYRGQGGNQQVNVKKKLNFLHSKYKERRDFRRIFFDKLLKQTKHHKTYLYIEI